MQAPGPHGGVCLLFACVSMETVKVWHQRVMTTGSSISCMHVVSAGLAGLLLASQH